ncbi:transcription initiation factor TFIID subunit 8-like [Panicum miliaceum]|uniref:Transcription initiation factor TFIID subunit 8-like n=1 Tax=Panicum miliaceum TaxID=4540 RepID=A0A3L6QKQ0_PANMI|nr:transcription initiation factor TFIID subunit 8-like [Panicum miliaceum]
MATPAKRPSNAAGASPIPRRLQAAVSTVSTAQILRASGYSAAEAAALRALSDIAGRYIESLGRAAAAFAEVHGRTEPNVADVVLALEDHALGGFPGASDPARPVLCSGALAELAGFVDAVTEVPFAKPLPRRDPGSVAGKGWESFAAAEREPPLRHVPQWLPRFPEGWEERLHGRGGEAEAKDEEDTGEVVAVMANGNGVENGRRAVPENREKVSFCLREKRRRHAVPPEKFGGALERFVKKQEKFL